MTTFLRLLKFVRYINAFPKVRATKINFENVSILDTLLNPQPVFLTKGLCTNHASVVHNEPNINQEIIDIDQKMTILNRELNIFGRITKFNIDDILQDIKKLETVTSLQGLFLLRCCSELIVNKQPSLRRELGDKIWRTLKELNVNLDVSHYNTLLSIYLKNDYKFSPLDFLEEMLNSNIKPNRVTFQRLIAEFCNQGKMEEAIKLLKQMKQDQIPINEKVLSSFIWGHSVNNNMDEITKVLKDMDLHGVKPTIQTYSTLMYTYAKNGDIDCIRKTLAECNNKDIWVPDKVLLQIIYYLSLNGFTEFVDEILSMTTKGMLYSKDAIPIIYKLIEQQQDNIAFKIFQSIPKDSRDQDVTSGNFFIETLINFQTPIERSVEYCRYMEKEGLNQRAFLSAMNKSLTNDMYESTITFMKAWNELGGPVRENYFYPIFKAYGETHQLEGIKKILKKMVLEFGIHPSIYTLKSHILPYMENNADVVLESLINNYVEYHTALNAIVMHLLSNNRIREAYKFMVAYYAQYKTGMIKYNLLQAFKNTQDAPSFIGILHFIYKATLDENMFKDSYKENKYLVQQFVDSCIVEAIDLTFPNNKYLFLMLFRNLIDKGISISPQIINEVKNKMKNNITKEIADALKIMETGDLVPKPINKEYENHWTRKYTDIEKLESTAKILSITNNKMAMKIKRNLLIYYCKTLNEQKVEELLEEFNKNNMNISTWIYILLISMYLDLHKIEKAEFWLCKRKKTYPSFKLNPKMNLKLATALVEIGQIEKAEQYITSLNSPNSLHVVHASRKLLDTISKLNDAELLQRFFDLLYKYGYITNLHSSSLFDPFIQIHLAQKDTVEAMRKFEWVYRTYKKAPCKVELMKICIKNKDNDLLERIISICKKVYSETKTYFDLAMAYLENNDLQKTRSIIENNCADLYEEHVIYFAENYYHNGQIDHLERLFEVLNNLKYDVERLCVLLLKSYSMQKEWNKGYNLWKKMQEDDIEPSNNFINCLNLILKDQHNIEKDSFQNFNIAIHNDDWTTARELVKRLPLVYKSECYSLLCKKHSMRNSFSIVLELWKELTKNSHLDLDLNVAEFILSKLVKEQDVENIEKIGSFLSTVYKKKLKFNYYLNQVYLQAGSWNIYLKNLQSKLEDESVTWECLNIHHKSVVHSLNKYPEFTHQFENVARKFADKNILTPIHALWIHFFIQNNNNKADEIWFKYVKNISIPGWLEVIDYPEMKNNTDAYLKLAKLLKQSSIKRSIKFYTFSKIISRCIQLESSSNYEMGLRCLQIALLEFSMQDFDVNLLVDLQKGLEKFGIAWPWTADLNKTNETTKRPTNDLIL